jgi:deoxyuridine 5'-triphosphate nucleotidohydrolase
MSRFNEMKENILNTTNATALKDFMRSVFNEFGSINKKTIVNSDLVCTIDGSKFQREIFDFIMQFRGIKCEAYNHVIAYRNHNALDLLGAIYDNVDARYRDPELYKLYLQWRFDDVPISEIPACLFIKKDPRAVVPFKNRLSDVGLDLTAIEKVKDINSTTVMLETGIIVSPPLGYYSKIYPRSSLVKSGYMLVNSVGIIDGTYRDTLKICLVKVNPQAPELIFPFKCCQLIFEKQIYMEMEEVGGLDATTRDVGGFGSTN